MIVGTINNRLEAIVPLLVHGIDGNRQLIDAILDTGFTGSLTLPLDIIERLQLPWRSRGSATLANGVVEECDIYVAVIDWVGVLRPILVEGMENAPLLGMALLAKCDLRARIVTGGNVEIERVQ